MLAALVNVVSLVVMALNAFGGIIGGIWLATKGEFKPTFLCLGILLLGTVIFAFSQLPSLAVGLISAASWKRSPLLGAMMGSLSLVLSYAGIFALGTFVFSRFGYFHENGSALPYLLIGYTAATGPAMSVAAKELLIDKASLAGLPVFGLQVGLVIASAVYYFSGEATAFEIFGIPFATMSLVLIMHLGEVVRRYRVDSTTAKILQKVA